MDLNKREWVIIGVAAALLLTVISGFYLSSSSSSIEEETLDWLQLTSEEEIGDEIGDVDDNNLIVVDVKGAVVAPGVYEMNGGERMIDAIHLAGGLTADADETKVNLAALLEDEMVVYIPKLGEEMEEPMFTAVSARSGQSKDDGKVAINQASSAELETLPGIGPARAAAIISYREQHGPFKTVEDLLNISGIGPKSLEKLKEHVMIK